MFTKKSKQELLKELKSEPFHEKISKYGEVDILMSQIRANNSTNLHDAYKVVDLEGHNINLEDKLWSWGTKEVYLINLEGKQYALALPGYIDWIQVIKQKWAKAMEEVENTIELKNKGYIVNDEIAIKELLVNGVKFPAILMKPYNEHKFTILDGKNTQGNSNPLLTSEMELDDDKMMDLCVPLLHDISNLIKDWICLGLDNFNICAVDWKLRLFLNDLWNMKVEQISDKELYIKYYLMYSIGAIVNSLSRDAYKKNDYLNKLEMNEGLGNRMKNIIRENLI